MSFRNSTNRSSSGLKNSPRNQEKKNGATTTEEEDEQQNSLKAFVSFHLDKFFVEHIPVDSIRELSNACKALS